MTIEQCRWRGAALALVMLAAAALPTVPARAAGAETEGLSAATSAHLKTVLAQSTSEPQFNAPGPAIDPASLKGKLIFTIPLSTAIPFCAVLDRQMAAFAKKLGIRTEFWQNDAKLDQWVQGFTAAAAHKAALINVSCGLDPAVISPQIRQAIAAGTPVVAGHNYVLGQKTLPGLAGIVYGNYLAAARLETDWVILQTAGHADALVITSPSTANSPYIMKAIADEFHHYCPDCRYRSLGVNAADWPTKIRPQVQSAILADPHLDYVIPIYDAMVPFVVPAIIADGETSRVKVASFNATPAVLDMIRTGDVVTFDSGEDTTWLAGAILDQDLRVLLGKPLVPDYVAGIRAFTKANVAATGVPAEWGKGYGTSALSGYAQLWGEK
ncbi:MAG: sugar ABC transporter substrate-binding protein [Acetobacteraceae bacterium]